MVNYACHPTTLAWENTLISPDFPGAMREVVERATAAPCVFLQGASGDLGRLRDEYCSSDDQLLTLAMAVALNTPEAWELAREFEEHAAALDAERGKNDN